jgi:SAM-dependent methyltransferase
MDATNELSPKEAKELVRRGYDIASRSYRSDTGLESTHYKLWLPPLMDLLSAGARVLDLGCGNGMPADQILVEHGFQVTGVDISPVMIERAVELVPAGKFICADMTTVDFSEEEFDAVIPFYAIIHVPVEEQPTLFQRIYKWLRPGGHLLATLGWRAWTGMEDDWHGTQMYWSHADEATYRKWLGEIGFVIERSDFIPEGDGGHALIVARNGN